MNKITTTGSFQSHHLFMPSGLCHRYLSKNLTIGTGLHRVLRSTVGGMPVFGRRTDPVLCSTFRGRVTTMWVNRPLKISQLGQLSLSSFRGR